MAENDSNSNNQPIKYTITIEDPGVSEKTKSVVDAFNKIGESAIKASKEIDDTAEKIKATGIALEESATKMTEATRAMTEGMVNVNSTIEDNTQKLNENKVAAAENVTAHQSMEQAASKSTNVFYQLVGGQEKYKKILEGMPPTMKMVVSEFTGLLNVSRAFIATPLGAILAAIVLSFQAMNTWLNSDAEALKELNKITGYFSGVLSGLKQVAIDIGKALYYAFSDTEKALKSLKNAFADITNIGKVAEETSKLSELDARMRKARMQWQVKEANMDARIAELRTQMNDQSKTAADRAKAAAEAEELINKKYDARIKIAKAEYEIVKKRNSLTTSSQEDLEKEAELEAAMIREKAAQQRELNMFVRRASNMDKQMASAEAKLTKQENTLEMKMLNSQLKRARQQKELETMVTQVRIDAMEDGHQKEMKQLELDEAEMLDKAAQMREEYLKQKIEDAKAIFDADPKNKNKKFNPGEITLSGDEIKKFDDYTKAIRERAAKQRQDLLKEEQDDMNGYLMKYGDYQEQRVAIATKYAELRAKAENEWQEKMVDADETEELRQLDEKFEKTTKAMADLFGDASKKTVNAIQSIIDKYDALVDYMQGGETTRSFLESLGFSDDELRKIDRHEIKLKDVTDRIKELKGELADKSPWKTFEKAVKDGAKMLDKELGGGIDYIAKAIKDFMPSLQEFGSNIANIFGSNDDDITSALEGLEGIATTAQGVGQIMAGDLVGGAMSAVKGISQAVDALDGLFGADYSQYEKMVEEYNLLSGIWDDLIAKKKEYLTESYGIEAAAVEKEAEEILKKKLAENYDLLKTLASSGASLGSHSLGYRVNKKMSNADWKNLASLAGSNISGFGDILSLSPEQIAKTLESDKFVSVLNSVNADFLTYLQNIANYRDELEDLQDSLNEQITNTSFNTIYNEFVSKLNDMDVATEDFANSMSEKFMSAMLSQQIGKQYREKLNEWYNKFAREMQDGSLSEAEMTALRQEYMQMVDAALKERDRIAEVTGYKESQMNEYTQSATKGAYTSMSQETGDELLGRETAQQIALEDIQIKAEGIASNVEQMRNLAMMGVEHLERIEQNTNELYQINQRLGRIEENTARL